MSQFVVNTKVANGNVIINNVPFSDKTDIKVICIPKIDINTLSFNKVRSLTNHIKDNLSDDIVRDRIDR